MPPRAESRNGAAPTEPRAYDAIVVGAGFGGLGCALRLVELGARPLVLETLSYAGGCASTFERSGYRFEAGATLFSGFDEGQLFRRWIERHALAVEFERLDPVIRLRAPGLELDVPPERARFVERLCALPGAPREALRRFFAHQAAVADALWGVLDDPALVPPFGARALFEHARRLPRYLPLARFLARPLAACLAAHGLERYEPLRVVLEALSRITVQCGIDEAETAHALATLDYPFRGTGHVRGGIGELASALVGAIRGGGGEVLLSTRVRALERTARGWRVDTRRGSFEAPQVALNLLPSGALKLLGEPEAPARGLRRLQRDVEGGWGACMLYRVCRMSGEAPAGPSHYQLVHDTSRPFVEGNHVFCSVAGAGDVGRSPEGTRTMTVSTHVPIGELRALPDADRGDAVEAIQQRMRETIAARAPAWLSDVEDELTASPRTFARFTGREEGWVGGVPRRASLASWLRFRAPRPRPGLVLVGDSTFPGQSTLATALGGWKAAESIAREVRR